MLNNKQKKVAWELSGNTLVRASPGTGKTRTLVARAQKKLETKPKHCFLGLITYTNVAADEISVRLQANDENIFVGTIHRFCLEFILRPFNWIYKWNKPRIISFEELREFVETTKGIDLGDYPFDQLNKIKKTIDGELDLSAEWNCSTPIEDVASLYFNFLDKKKAIDFNSILYNSYKIISENPFVSKSLANKFHEILIDEFQDTNIYQYEILKAINDSKTCTFFMVGDEKQRIYQFAGAIEKSFERASIDFNATIESLDTTYRSTWNIINTYSSLFPDHPKLLNESKYKTVNNKVVIHEVANKENTNYIEKCVRYFLESCNVQMSEIAILTTNWRDAFLISKALRTKYQVVGLGALPHKNIYSSTFALIRCLAKYILFPSHRNLKIIKRNVDIHLIENDILLDEKEFTNAVNALITYSSKIDRSVNLFHGLTILNRIFNSTFRIKHSGIDEIKSNIKEEEANEWTLEKYFRTISGINGITVNTIHQSKGLEFEIVILSSINENKIPYQKFLGRKGNEWIFEDLTEVNKENGRTLLYVGLSRAKVQLVVTHHWKYSMFIPIIKESNNHGA